MKNASVSGLPGKKFITMFAVAGIILLLVAGGLQAGLFNYNENKNDEYYETEFIVLEIPVIEYSDENKLTQPIIKSYTQQNIYQNDDFIIESATLGFLFENSVGDIKLKLAEILPNSVNINVLADERHDGNFYPRMEAESYNIKNGSCITAYPLVLDVSYKYCFELSTKDSTINLKYKIEEESTMPYPN